MSFLEYAARFIAIGFIAGSVVHLGEGTNVWDIAVLCIGLILFLWTSIKSASREEFDTLAHRMRFIGISFLLAVGIGMASGGFQHFVDTPEYSSLLIPIGLLIGYGAYELSHNRKIGLRKVCVIILCALITGYFMNWLGHILVDIGLVVPHSH